MMRKFLFILMLAAAPALVAQDGAIEFKGGHGKKWSLDFNIKGLTDPDPIDNRAIPIFMIIMGAGLILIWMMDVANGKFRDQGNLLEWKNEGGDHMWVHLLAEYATAGLLIAGAIGLLGQNGWGYKLSLASLGALAYTSLNSLAWVFANRKRFGYAIPMLIGFVGSVAGIIILID